MRTEYLQVDLHKEDHSIIVNLALFGIANK